MKSIFLSVNAFIPFTESSFDFTDSLATSLANTRKLLAELNQRIAMKNMLAIFLALMAITYLSAQEVPKLTEFDPLSFMLRDHARPKVLLVGSFHFDYPNLDSHKTEAEDQIDVKSEARRAELRELIDYIAAFRPNKIIIERRPGSTINDIYRKWLADPETKIGKGEVYQLAFPLAKRFGVDSLIIGDSWGLSNSLYWGKDSLTMRAMMEEIFDAPATYSDTLMDTRYWELYDLEDKMESQARLLDIFRYMNAPERIKIGHGHYLQFFHEREPDGLALNWYSRNLRIYRNIRNAATSPDDRIMVLFGAGHLGILNQQLESDPSLEGVPFNEPDKW